MAKYLLLIQSDCNDASREDEFNKWYNEVHVPDVLTNSGFIRAVRYEQVFIPGTVFEKDKPTAVNAKYLALYEIETDDIDKVMKAAAENTAKMREKGRMTDLLSVAVRGVFKQT